MKRLGTRKSLTQEGLSHAIEEVLDLPRDQRQGEAYEIAQSFIKAMINLALTGEDIEIEGFGIFRWVTQPARKRIATYFYNPKEPVHTIIEVPPKRYLSFQPSKVLKRIVHNVD